MTFAGMNGEETVIFFLTLAMAALLFVLSFFQFRQRGFLLNNSYIFADKGQRGKMDKAPHFRQSSAVFFILGLMMASFSANIALECDVLKYIGYVFAAVAVIYAIISGVKIERAEKKKK